MNWLVTMKERETEWVKADQKCFGAYSNVLLYSWNVNQSKYLCICRQSSCALPIARFIDHAQFRVSSEILKYYEIRSFYWIRCASCGKRFEKICFCNESFSITFFEYEKGNPSCWKNMRSQVKVTTHSTHVQCSYFWNFFRYDILNILNVNKWYKYALFDARLECLKIKLFICFGLIKYINS